jgi:hypothetical protein
MVLIPQLLQIPRPERPCLLFSCTLLPRPERRKEDAYLRPAVAFIPCLTLAVSHRKHGWLPRDPVDDDT